MEVYTVVFLILLYRNLRSVIPAKAGIQIEKTGFRIKSGMTKCVKSFLRHYNSIVLLLPFLYPSDKKFVFRLLTHRIMSRD